MKVIVKSSITTEKRLMVYIRAAREAYERGYINDVGWIRWPANVSDGMNKLSNCKPLSRLLEVGKITTEVEQRVTRQP